MLILTRKPGESLYIGDDIKITIVELKGHQIRVGIQAPKDMRIYREEIYLQILEENKTAASAPLGAEAGLESLTQAWSERNAPSAAGGAGDSSGNEDSGDEDKPKVSGLGAFSRLKVKEAGSSRGTPPADSSEMRDPEVVVKRKRSKKADE